jgi:hypothetical protein
MNINLSIPYLVYAANSIKRRLVREALNAIHGPLYARSPMDIAADQFHNTLSPNILWKLNGRFERGVAMAKQGAVSRHIDHGQPEKPRLFKVKSSNQSRPPYHYLVDLESDQCDCPDLSWQSTTNSSPFEPCRKSSTARSSSRSSHSRASAAPSRPQEASLPCQIFQ